ncbi:MAG: triose-phosphate isomerase [Hyphomicrobiales bacterium]|nr:triose-phosphate isomerase [Hyphomicrobiales bacterium]
MAIAPKPLVAGNWKMNGLRGSLETASAIARGVDAGVRAKVDVLICPPATILHALTAAMIGTGIATGGQDCHASPSGAFTGDISAPMLADAGASFVILGHSERRTLHGETSADVKAKAEAALRALLVPIICIGETLAEREAGRTIAVVQKQVRGSLPETATGASVVIAYEPVWAIGTGKTPTAADVAELHAEIRAELGRLVGKAEAAKVKVLYGGSVKPSNAAELMALPDVNGALVGGASLKAEDFLGIIRAV